MNNTKLIRLEWSTGDTAKSFEDFEISSSATTEKVQSCIDNALSHGYDEIEFFKQEMHNLGYKCEEVRKNIEVFDFNQ